VVLVIFKDVENFFAFVPYLMHGHRTLFGQDLQYIILEPQKCFEKSSIFFGIGSIHSTKKIGQLNHFIPKTIEFSDGLLSFLIGTGDGENQWKNNGNTQNGKINLKIEIEFIVEKIDNQCFGNNEYHSKIDCRINDANFLAHFLK
jgi:hypothetical protein